MFRFLCVDPKLQSLLKKKERCLTEEPKFENEKNLIFNVVVVRVPKKKENEIIAIPNTKVRLTETIVTICSDRLFVRMRRPRLVDHEEGRGRNPTVSFQYRNFRKLIFLKTSET